MRFGAPPGSTTAALATHLGAPVTEVAGDGEYLVAGAGHAGARRRPHRVAGRARPAARRPARRPAAARGRVPPPRLGPWPPDADRTTGGEAGREAASLAHLRLELALLARNGESLLLTLGIPVLLLVFFANVDVLPIDGEPIDFLAPGRARRWPCCRPRS